MQNFATCTCGYFIVIGPKSPQPLAAELICSAVIDKLVQDRPHMNDISSWLSIVQMVPGISLGQEMALSYPADTEADLLSGLLNGLHPHPTPELLSKLTTMVAPFGITTALNCMILDQSDPSCLRIYLTEKQVDIGVSPYTIKGRSWHMIIGLSLGDAASQIQSVLSDFGAPAPAPYYLRL